MTQISEEELRRIATERVKKKRGFRTHLITYIVVNIFLILVWYFTSRVYFWPGWVIGGWGIGVAFHAVSTYWKQDVLSEKQEIEKEMEKMRKDSQAKP